MVMFLFLSLFLLCNIQAESHMELSKSGIVPKLLDFIRINEDSEQLQILGKDCVEMSMLKCLPGNGTKQCAGRQAGRQVDRQADR